MPVADAMSTRTDPCGPSARRASPGRRSLAELGGMSPAYFGMVMATGVVSLAAHLLAMPRPTMAAMVRVGIRARRSCTIR